MQKIAAQKIAFQKNMLTRAAALALALTAFAGSAPAWVESVEFPWNACPKPLWERELVWIKNIGIRHVSLPPAPNAAELAKVIQIVRRLGIEADLEGPVPDSLLPLTAAHGGPLTGPLPGPVVRISALSPSAAIRVSELLSSGIESIVWTEVKDTLGPRGYKPGAVSFEGEEKPGTIALRRSALLSAYWNKSFASLRSVPGAGVLMGGARAATPGPTVRQFAGEKGVSVVAVVNKSARPWKGDLRVLYPRDKRVMTLTGVSVPGRDSLWLPIGVPLVAGPLCKDCSAFSNTDHIVYATAELTTVEYENGILAMEFAAPSDGEVVLQLSREPSGPLLAGGKPVAFDWDEHTLRAKLKIPHGKGADGHVRIGLAIEPPDATAFFDKARVLMIGETNRLTAQFSSEAIENRSRLRTSPMLEFTAEPRKDPADDPLELTYAIKVPATAVHGDYADMAIEADGLQMSHVHPQLLLPVRLRFPDAINVHVAANSALPLFPATIPVNQRSGRELVLTIRNNAPEIRNFVLEPKVEGIDFSPVKMEITVGASAARDLSFRVFANQASPGLHAGAIAVSGAASLTEPVQIAVIPQSGAVAYAASGFSFLESLKTRATFMPGRWLEFLNKENDQNRLGSTGVPFTAGPIEVKGDALVFQGKAMKLEELEQMAARGKR